MTSTRSASYGEAGRPLSPEEKAVSLPLLGVALLLPRALDARLQRETGHSLHEYQVLLWLSVSENGCQYMSSLAEAANVTPSHLSRVAARLERRGALRRVPDPGDARFILAELTDDGRRLLDEAAPVYRAALRQFVFEGLSDQDMNDLGHLSKSVLASLRDSGSVPSAMEPALGARTPGGCAPGGNAKGRERG
jgi:DNA-binding MarR family transcriptional regulator